MDTIMNYLINREVEDDHLEWLVDENCELMVFDTKELANKFLEDNIPEDERIFYEIFEIESELMNKTKIN